MRTVKQLRSQLTRFVREDMRVSDRIREDLRVLDVTLHAHRTENRCTHRRVERPGKQVRSVLQLPAGVADDSIFDHLEPRDPTPRTTPVVDLRESGGSVAHSRRFQSRCIRLFSAQRTSGWLSQALRGEVVEGEPVDESVFAFGLFTCSLWRPIGADDELGGGVISRGVGRVVSAGIVSRRSFGRRARHDGVNERRRVESRC